VRRFDVAVVGGGPAGATAARELASAGVQTVLFERERLPRYKSCAGGIPLRTARLLPFPLESVVEDAVYGIDVSYRGRPQFQHRDGCPFALMVMRDRFDQLLVERAVESGAVLMQSCQVRTAERDGKYFTLRAGSDVFQAEFVIGADGANSRVALETGLGRGLSEAAAIEAEVRAPLAALARWRGMVNVDLGYRPRGYGWLFPKRGLLSIGLVQPRELASALRPNLRKYLEDLGLGAATIERVVGHKVLFRHGNEPIAGAGVLLAGDAAGMVDEFTEEGIYYAVRSGELAARAIARALQDSNPDLRAYESAVDREIMPELQAARTIAGLYYGTLHHTPAAMLFVSRSLRYLWNAFFRVQRGESSYAAEVRRARLVAPLGRLLLR
jgi:geranylgeranyl reductase family protein